MDWRVRGRGRRSVMEESQGGLPPVAEFAAWLVALKVRSGDPTLEQLSRLTGHVPRGHQVPKSTLGKALQGRSSRRSMWRWQSPRPVFYTRAGPAAS
jgi:hypothetical protein